MDLNLLKNNLKNLKKIIPKILRIKAKNLIFTIIHFEYKV